MNNRIKLTGFTLVLLSLMIYMPYTTAAPTWMVEAGDYFVWKLTPPPEQSPFYIKAKVLEIGENLTFKAWVYNPNQDELTEDSTWAEVVRNYVYSKEMVDLLESTHTNETVQRIYGNKTLTIAKITIDSDNILYIDKATGVLCEGKIDLGQTKYTIQLVSWEDIDMSAFAADQGLSGGSIDAYPFSIMGIISLLTILLIRRKER